MSGALWWDPFPHRHHDHPPCDCDPVPQMATVTVKDAAGDVRAVRDAEFYVRPHRDHRERGGRHERVM